MVYCVMYKQGELNVKHSQIISRPYYRPQPIYYEKRKHLTNPTVDVICVVAGAVVLLIGGYMHVRVGW